MMNDLEKLKQYTTVVADTGDFQLLHFYKPQDATTNPSLILKAAQQTEYAEIVKKIRQDYAFASMDEKIDRLLVAFGQEILKVIPGRVSTEVDARLSFNTDMTLMRARQIINWYEASGIPRERILIKIASTWEGIMAAKVLEQENIHCNMTLLFAFEQAVLCAQANCQLISPFVGRILDWYKHHTDETYTAENDPGVISVRNIFNYYKQYGYRTEVMGASFRSKAQVLALSGCDLLTISPALLKELQDSDTDVKQMLVTTNEDKSNVVSTLNLDEANFRYALNQNQMAYEKLGEGIRLFAQDTVKLEMLLA
jgi:transaldolase